MPRFSACLLHRRCTALPARTAHAHLPGVCQAPQAAAEMFSPSASAALTTIIAGAAASRLTLEGGGRVKPVKL